MSMSKCAAVLLLLGMSAATLADTMVYDNEVDFLAILDSPYYYEPFDDMDWGTVEGPTADFGPVNGYSWQASAPGGVFSVPGALGTADESALLTISFTGAPVTAVAGNFYATDFDGLPIPAIVTASLNDGTVATLADPAAFTGFSSDVALTSLTIEIVDSGGANAWSTMDNFYVGSFIPEPASIVLLGLVGLMLPRRRCGGAT